MISGLGFWSEQAMEAVHADFKKSWDNIKVDKDHELYLTRLSECIARYNARHL